MKRPIEFCILVAVILCSVVLQWALLTKGQDWGDDFASYLMQARSIVEGNPTRFIEENRFTIEHSTNFLVTVAAPWGTPVMLAPLYKLFGMNLLAFKSLNVVFYVLFLASLAFFLRARHPFLLLVVLVSFFAFNPTLLTLLDSILSDIPFLFFSTVCVFLIGRRAVGEAIEETAVGRGANERTAVEGPAFEQSAIGGARERRSIVSAVARGIVLGALMAAAYFMRTNGLLLVLTLLGMHIAGIIRALGRVPPGGDRRPAAALRFIGSAVRSNIRRISVELLPYVTFTVLVVVWNATFPQGEGTHWRLLESVSLRTALRHMRAYAGVVSDFFIGVPHHHVWYVALLPFSLVGLVKSARRDYHMILYALLTLGLYFAWPFTQGMRYLIPLLPFYIHFMFVGIRWAYEAMRDPWRRMGHALLVGVVILTVVFFVKDSASQAVRNLRDHRSATSGPYAEASQEMFNFIRNNTGADAVIIFFKPRLMRMVTGRQAIKVDDAAEVGRGDYLCFYIMKNPYHQISLNDVIRLAGERRLVQVYSNPDFRLYRIVHSLGRA